MTTSDFHQLLSPYLTPPQEALLLYEGSLPQAQLAELGERLRTELAALRTLVADPVAQGQQVVEQQGGLYLRGSLLCADLSGFTALTEQLATQSRQGEEELSGIINRIFAPLLEEIDNFGGVVLKFGGDALTVFFNSSRLGNNHRVLACTAALALQRRMAEFESLPTSAGPWTPRLRIGVHSGRIFVAPVGDEQRRELLVTGSDVNRAMLAQERSAPGEVVVTAGTLEELEGARSEPRQGGLARLLYLPPSAPLMQVQPPSLPPIDSMESVATLATRIAALRLYLPAALPQRFILAGGEAGEFRPVSVVFINFFSFSNLLTLMEGKEHLAVRALTSYYTRVQEVIHRYGGSINKLDVASFGDKLMALFGAPMAQEDDPLRAVQAALDLRGVLVEANREIQELLKQNDHLELHSLPGSRGLTSFALRQRIGIATGSVFAGMVGTPQRREYTVIGQTVNLAARLMGAAEQDIVLLAPATWRAVEHQVVLQHVPPLPLKGIASLVNAAQALYAADEMVRPLVPQRAPLVGRAGELATLRALAQDVRAGTGRVVALSGEAGVGKSRLAYELLDDAITVGVRNVAVSCRSYAQTAPYSAIRDLLIHLLELPSAVNPDALRDKLGRAIHEYAPESSSLAPLLYGMFGAGRSEDSFISQPSSSANRQGWASSTSVQTRQERRQHDTLAMLPPSERRALLHDLLEALIGGMAARQPLVLLLDDLHYADASSLEVVQRFTSLARNHALLLLLLYRPEPGFAEPWLALPHATALPLDPLDQASSTALLATLLGGTVPPALLPLLDRTQGSPFFLEALVQHLVELRVLEQGDNGTWQLLRPLDEVSIPIDIERMLAARLDRLEEQTRQLVQVASVIGTRIHYPVLAGVYSQAQRLAQRLTYLVNIDLLQIDERDDESPFRFRQTLLREVAYNGILYSLRRDLHRRVAERLELLSPNRDETALAELAHHYLLAEEWQRACAYHLQMARRAYARYATTEALASYRQAYQLAMAHPEAVTLGDLQATLEGLADVEVLAGHYDEAHLHYRTLLALVEPGYQISDAQVDRLSRANAVGDRPALSQSPAFRAMLRRKIGGVYEHQGQFDAALEWMRNAGAVLKSEGRRARVELARVCSDTGWVHFRRGALDATEHWLLQSLDLLSSGGDGGDETAADEERLAEVERARAENRLGGVAWSRGDLDGARAYVERSLEKLIALEDLPGQADAQNNLGVLADQCGDWEQAIAAYEGALAIDQQIGRRRDAALSVLNLGIAHLRHGDLEPALQLLGEAAMQTATVEDTLHEAMALRWLGRALTQARRWDEARAALQQALTRTDRHGLLLESLDAHAALGELALAQGDPAGITAARRAGDTVLPQVERCSPEVGYFLRFAAQAERQWGNHAQADALLDECDAVFRDLDMRAELAINQALRNQEIAHRSVGKNDSHDTRPGVWQEDVVGV